MKHRIISIFKSILLTVSVIYMCCNPFQITYHCRKALEMCYRTVIPSLFMFTVFSLIIASVCEKIKDFPKPVRFTSCRIFGMNTRLFILCIFGFFSGAASACAGIERLYMSKSASKNECENALMLLPGCSMPFILTVVASSLGNAALAYTLLLCNLLALLTSFFILCRRDKNFSENTSIYLPYSATETKRSTSCVTAGMSCMINMCSFIIFFRVISGTIGDLMTSIRLVHPSATPMIHGLFEMTSGIISASSLNGNERIMAVCILCGFSGISIIFQVWSICMNCSLDIKRFIYSRLLCSILCPLYMLAFLFIFPPHITCFFSIEDISQNVYSPDSVRLFCRSFITCIIGLTALILICIEKKHKKNV